MRLRFPASITARLAVLFSFVIVLTFGLLGTYLYRSLASQLESRDDEELMGKVVQIRHLLSEVSSADEIAKVPFAFMDAVYGHEGLVMRLVAADGRVLVKNAEWPGFSAPTTVIPADREPSPNDLSAGRIGDAPARSVAAAGFVGEGAGEQILIFLARDASARQGLLAVYLSDLGFAGAVGMLLAAALGYATLQHGLKPIGAVAKKANEITSRRLDSRLELHDAPTELRELTTAFNAMLDRLEDGVRRLAGFAGDLAHDLRTPLNALMVSTQVALSRPRTADELQAILVANLEAYERLSRLIENTLFLARADNAQLALKKQLVDLPKTLGKIVEYFSGPAEDAGVAVNMVASGVVVADAVLFDRAISNLVANALRYSERGSTVRIVGRCASDDVLISVENSGSEIPVDQRERIFEPYFRGDTARAGADGAAGLGLAIVKAIMKLHGGAAEATCAEGVTRFTLRFPSAHEAAA
jgi:two-component system heavy metal sensor histidine kinase CusS